MDIHTLLHPTSVAIVGASRNPMKIGNIVIQNLLSSGYSGDIFPVNPKATSIHELSVYKKLQDIKKTVDLCIIALPASLVIQELEEAIRSGCTTYIVYTAGFKEIGSQGKHIEQQLTDIATKAGVTLLGPNCLGCIHTPSKLNASFASVSMTPGNVDIISQSGAIASALFDRTKSTHIGLRTCATVGNKAILNETHFLEYRQENTDLQGPIGLYLEEISEGKHMIDLLNCIQTTRPIILLKPGRSESAQHAMQSHTGSIAGEDAVLDAMCTQTNTIRVNDIESFFTTLMYFSRQAAPTGNRIAIITNAGGPGVITTDLIEAYGLQTASLNNKTQTLLQEQLPRASSVSDPIDVLGDAQADRYAIAIEGIIQDSEDVDAIVILLTPQIMTQIQETATIIAEKSKKHNMPIVCAFIGQHDVLQGKEVLRKHHIPCYDYPRQAVSVLGNARNREQKRNIKSTTNHIDRTKKATPDNIGIAYDTGLLSGKHTQQLLDTYSIPAPVSDTIDSTPSGKIFAQVHGYPVVLKLVGPKLLHKIDVGGIITDISNDTELEEQFSRIKLQQTILQDEGQEVSIQIQQQVSSGVECILGIKRDPQFGPVLMFGAGGTLTELFHDHSLCILPTSRAYLENMLLNSSIAPLLSGYRGEKAMNISGLLDVIESFITLILDHPRIAQAEINPIIINESGTWAVDPKIIIS